MSNLRKIGKYIKEIGEIINEIGKNRNFHRYSIDTESARCMVDFYNNITKLIFMSNCLIFILIQNFVSMVPH